MKPFFLDVFAGAAGVTRALERRKLGCYSFDVLQGESGDVLRPAVQKRLLKMVSGGSCVGIMAAPPCTTFSLARQPPVRDKQNLYGKKDLGEKERAQVQQANQIVAFTFRLLETASRFGVP